MAGLVGDQLDGAEQADAAHLADERMLGEAGKAILQVGAGVLAHALDEDAPA